MFFPLAQQRHFSALLVFSMEAFSCDCNCGIVGERCFVKPKMSSTAHYRHVMIEIYPTVRFRKESISDEVSP